MLQLANECLHLYEYSSTLDLQMVIVYLSIFCVFIYSKFEQAFLQSFEIISENELILVLIDVNIWKFDVWKIIYFIVLKQCT